MTTQALYDALKSRSDVRRQPLRNGSSDLFLSAEAARWFLRQPGTRVEVYITSLDLYVEVPKTSIIVSMKDLTGHRAAWGDDLQAIVTDSDDARFLSLG